MLRRSEGLVWAVRWLAAVMVWMTAAIPGWAGNPRWVTGAPYFTNEGVPVVWYTNQPLYFTDPGDLSASVNHAAADALVAAAAGVWNVSTSSLVLAQGGSLAEHVNGSNAFASQNGVIFPADVASSNYASKQIAVIYDSDGSVTDLLLGNGASDPTGCRQNAVTESVDSIVPAGFIQHAVLVLNGRCTGPAPEQQLQMQYQLMRAFGRVLGLGWSQTNDNVFTNAPQPTYNQALNWPIMHPIDIICGPYTYQCLPEPFTLRADDISELADLYFIAQGTAPAGKTDSLAGANQLFGELEFPTGQGMQGVNAVARRWEQYTDSSEAEEWYTVSSVTGAYGRRAWGNPVTGTDTSMTGSMGALNPYYEGYYRLSRIPMLPGDWQDVYVDTEPVNPLYTGQYAVGPYTANTVAPSGTDDPQLGFVLGSYIQAFMWLYVDGAAATCNPGADGTESAPATAAASGWWTGQLCGDGHSSWASFSVRGNRSLTVEVTAEDEAGNASTAKAMPVIGVWHASDATGTLPGVAAAGMAFNGETAGMTTLPLQFMQPDQLRMVIADERGNGRPDFNYQARVLYADSIVPATVSSAGGMVTITGMGFRPGNTVTVNGVNAAVSSWSDTSIVAVVPTLSALRAGRGLVADVTVRDLSTGGTTVMTQALTYGTPAPSLNLVSAPSGTMFVGSVAASAFAVKALAADGVTPLAGQSVLFTATGGAVVFGACGAASCTVMTNAAGIASTSVTALSAGTIVLSAAASEGTQTASFIAVAQTRTISAVQATEYVAAGATFVWAPQVALTDNSGAVAGDLVSWQTVSGAMVFSASQTQAGATGVAQNLATIGPLAGGEQASATACAWTAVCAGVTAVGVDAANLRVQVLNGAGQSVGASGSLQIVTIQVMDTASHPVAGATVVIHQTISAWQMACPAEGRCPVAPVYGSSVMSAVSDANGMITVVPAQMNGEAEVTEIAAVVGTQGFATLSLQKVP